MNIHLIWFGQLRDVVGVAEETVSVPDDATVASVLVAAADGRDEAVARILLRDGGLSPTILVSLGDIQVTDPATTPLTDGAQLVVMAPISGG